MTLEDLALLRRIATGDESAMRELYARYRPRLRGYLWLRLAGDAERVEDALQETFLAVWRGAAGFRGAASPATWIFQIAHRRALRSDRALDRRPEGHARQLTDDLAADSPEAAVLARLDLDGALARLTPHHREALDLVFVQGFTPREVAVILGVPLGTVKSRLSYARRALARALGEEIRHDA